MASLTPSPFYKFELPNGDTLYTKIHVGADSRAGGVRESPWTDRGMEVAIDFQVSWVDRIKLLYALRGSCGFNNGEYWRSLPKSLPRLADDTIGDIDDREDQNQYPWDRYFCSSIGPCRQIKTRVTDEDGDPTDVVGWPYYEEVVMPTVWTVPLYVVSDKAYDPKTVGKDPSGYPYTITRTHTSGEIFSPYTNAFKFTNEATPANEANIGILRAKTELSITRVFMPVLDTLTLDAMIGKINTDHIQFGSDVNPPESMLYLGYEYEPYVNPANGKIVYDVTHRLMVNGPVLDKDGNPQESWNYFMNRSGYWDKLVLKDDADRGVYDSTEFACKIWPEYVECKE
jgi:hypothetical protein